MKICKYCSTLLENDDFIHSSTFTIYLVEIVCLICRFCGELLVV